MADIWLAPYLPLRGGPATVGPWDFIPFREFKQRHTQGRDIYREARKLVTAYKVKKPSAAHLGAVVVPTGGRVGDRAERELMQPLHHALVVALLDNNPPFLMDDDEDHNAGHKIATSENGLLFGHPLQGPGANRYVIGEGTIAQTLDLRTAAPGRPLPPVGAPAGLPTASMGLYLDEEYGTAVYETLTAADGGPRRLGRCVQWVAIAMNNTDAIDEDTRIVAFRAGFEVLLGGGETKKLRTKLAELLGDDSKARPRTWTELDGKKRENVPLNDSEWWFQSFSLLRNAIAHGDEITEAQWHFPDTGKSQWAHADDYMRRAIKKTVITAGHDPDLEYDQSHRHMKRAYEVADARRRGDASTCSP